MSNALFAPVSNWQSHGPGSVMPHMSGSSPLGRIHLRSWWPKSTDEATTDEKVKAWQEREEKVMAALNAEREKINAYIRENLVKVNSDYDETADVETVKEPNGKIVAMRKYMEGVGGDRRRTLPTSPSPSLFAVPVRVGLAVLARSALALPRSSTHSITVRRTWMLHRVRMTRRRSRHSPAFSVALLATRSRSRVFSPLSSKRGTDDLSTKQGQDFGLRCRR